MTAPLTVSLPHSLGREEAVRRLKTGIERAAAGVPMLRVEQEQWNGEQLTFAVRALGQAANGQVNVRDDRVDIEVRLPWLLQKFAEQATQIVKSRGHLLLTKK